MALGRNRGTIPERGREYTFHAVAWPEEPSEEAVRLWGEQDGKYPTFTVLEPNGVVPVGSDEL